MLTQASRQEKGRKSGSSLVLLHSTLLHCSTALTYRTGLYSRPDSPTRPSFSPSQLSSLRALLESSRVCLFACSFVPVLSDLFCPNQRRLLTIQSRRCCCSRSFGDGHSLRRARRCQLRFPSRLRSATLLLFPELPLCSSFPLPRSRQHPSALRLPSHASHASPDETRVVLPVVSCTHAFLSHVDCSGKDGGEEDDEDDSQDAAQLSSVSFTIASSPAASDPELRPTSRKTSERLDKFPIGMSPEVCTLLSRF